MSRAVIDQPGLKIFSVGLIISLIFGFILKKQISSERLQSLLQKSVDRLEKDFFIDYETVEVKLSNWGVPWPRIEMSRIRLSPKKNSCQDSQIYIDKIEAPISFFALINSRSVIDTLRIQNVELRIADVKNCFKIDLNAKNTNRADIIEKKTSEVSQQKNDEVSLFKKSTSAQLKNVYIEKLKVITKMHAEQPLLFRQFHLSIDYGDRKISEINIKTQLLALNEPKNDIYYFVGDLSSKFKPNEHKEVDAELSLKGRMLDGPLQAFVQFNSVSQKLNYEIEANKISIKALLPYANLGEFDTIFEKWPLNLSFKLVGGTDFSIASQTNIKVKDFNITGEQTQILISNFDIKNKLNNFSQIQADPFEVQVVELPLTPLKNVIRLKPYLKSFDNLGFLSANINFTSLSNWKLTGYLKNTEMIFSNRGSRETQKIDMLRLSAHRANELSIFKIDQIKLNNIDIRGNAEFAYNFENQNTKAKMSVSGPILNDKVWKQLTQIEQNPTLKMSWNYSKQSQEEKQKLFMSIPMIEFPGLDFKSVSIYFDQNSTEANTSLLSLILKTNEVIVSPENSSSKPLKMIFSDLTGLTESQYKANNFFVTLKGQSWKEMNFLVDTSLNSTKKSKIHFKGSGSWKDELITASEVQVQNESQIFKFDIAKDSNNELILRSIAK